MNQVVDARSLTRKDFSSDQEVRWCPGCGDYAILATVQRLMPELGIPPEKMVWVSGIGCSSRFPYYMSTYGFHTIHGRAPGIATGIKVANPELSVWLVTGDGDGLSIGGNHLMHCLRRNVDINVLLFNNRIYGLTKGQYSPTSEIGKVTKSTPAGSVDAPLDPSAFALGAQASFVARSIDVSAKHLTDVLRRAQAHRGTSFVEIYQNCNVFNDNAFESFTGREHQEERQIHVRHGEPMQFGRDGELGLKLNLRTLRLEVVKGAAPSELLVHDETNPIIAQLLTRMPYPEMPVALGVLYAQPRPTYDQLVRAQRDSVLSKRGPKSPADLLGSGETWSVK
jgi:2-oxoglutarate ferredoxin oxidoreductase subunit beta